MSTRESNKRVSKFRYSFYIYKKLKLYKTNRTTKYKVIMLFVGLILNAFWLLSRIANPRYRVEFGRIFASTNNIPTKFHHSSFLGGKKVAMAGELEIIGGKIISLSNDSGHYKPTKEFLDQFLDFLKTSKIDIRNIDINFLK